MVRLFNTTPSTLKVKGRMETSIFGHTAHNLPIFAHHFGTKNHPTVLVLGGVHGNEPEGVIASMGLIEYFLGQFSFSLQVTVVPTLNLDGVLTQSRKNARGVDLNRNLPTADWTKNVAEEKYFPGTEANSEPENKALVTWLKNKKPDYIISLHSWKPCLNVNGDSGPEAQIISRLTGYEVNEYIGYPTPGSLGTYAGKELGIPTLTYEIERGMAKNEINNNHVPALVEALKSIEKRFANRK